jgi:hypothetical protein
MPAKRRDSAKVPELQDLPSRKRSGRPRLDKASRADFGDLQTRRQGQPVRARGQRIDSGPSDIADLPALTISPASSKER